MGLVTINKTGQVLRRPDEISAFLAQYGIWYRRFEGQDQLSDSASEQEVLAAYDEPIRRLKQEGAYTAADVIDVKADTPNLGAMLARFSQEHWHDEDEVRFVVAGRGIFHIHPRDGGEVFKIEVSAGDMINVPRGTWHWFDLCGESRIRCIRLFQDPSGWTPHYTASGEEKQHEPLCFGPRYIPAERA